MARQADAETLREEVSRLKAAKAETAQFQQGEIDHQNKVIAAHVLANGGELYFDQLYLLMAEFVTIKSEYCQRRGQFRLYCDRSGV